MRAILSFIVLVNILRTACAPVPVDLDWSKASDYHPQGSDEKAPDGKYTDTSTEVQNIKNAHVLGNKYIDAMEKVVNDPHTEEHKKILIHNFGEHHDLDQIKNGVKKLKEGNIGINNVRKQGVSGKASMSSAGLVTFKDGFHKLKTDDDRAGTFVHEASHALVGTLDRYREDKEKGHLVPITKKEHDATPADQKVVKGYLHNKQIHELLQDPFMKTQMHKNADSWKAFGHHAFHGEAHPLHPIEKKTEAVTSEVGKNHKRPHSDDDDKGDSSHGNAKRPKLSSNSSKAPSTSEAKTRQTVPPKAGSSNTRRKSNKLPESSRLKKSSTVRHSTEKKLSTAKKTASSHSPSTKSTKPQARLTKQNSSKSKSASKKTLPSSKKSKNSGRSKSTAKVQKVTSKSLPVTRKKLPAATRQKSKTSHVQASASSFKQKKVSSKTKPKLPSRKAVTATRIKQAVGASKKGSQKPFSKALSRPKATTPSKPKKQVLPKVRSQKQLSNKIPSTSHPVPKMQHVIKSKGRK